MTLRPCLRCGEPSSKSHCPEHRPKCTKSTAHARGYDDRWTQLSRRARRAQPFCSDCGATDDLQADHTPEAWARKAAGLPIRLQDIDVVCSPCNRSRGASRGETPSGRHQDPNGKAQSPLHTPQGYR